MTQITVNITDHALLRYIERQMQIPIETVRKHIAKQAHGPALLGASTFTIDDVRFSFSATVGGVVHVTTVLERKKPNNHHRKAMHDREALKKNQKPRGVR